MCAALLGLMLVCSTMIFWPLPAARSPSPGQQPRAESAAIQPEVQVPVARHLDGRHAFDRPDLGRQLGGDLLGRLAQLLGQLEGRRHRHFAEIALPRLLDRNGDIDAVADQNVCVKCVGNALLNGMEHGNSSIPCMGRYPKIESGAPMTSRERLRATLAHRLPDRIPLDFGGTAVTGIHVSCVAALRDYFGLEKRLVKVHEPYQMLGLVEPDLQQAMGLDAEGVFPRKTMFGFPNRDWKSWRMPDGLEVLVSEDFRVTVDSGGDTLIYPEGDATAPPSGRLPRGGYFFDTIVRQPPIDENNLNPEDNLEEFTPLAEEDIRYFRDEVARAAATGRGVIASFGGTAFGDIALVPAPVPQASQGYPRHRRMVHVHFQPPRLRARHLRPAMRDRAGQPGPRARGGGRRRGRSVPLRHRFRHADVHVLLGGHVQRVVPALLPAAERVDSPAHRLEIVQTFLRLGDSARCPASSRPASISSTRCSARPRAWTPRN